MLSWFKHKCPFCLASCIAIRVRPQPPACANTHTWIDQERPGEPALYHWALSLYLLCTVFTYIKVLLIKSTFLSDVSRFWRGSLWMTSIGNTIVIFLYSENAFIRQGNYPGLPSKNMIYFFLVSRMLRKFVKVKQNYYSNHSLF